jgi:plastocyanin
MNRFLYRTAALSALLVGAACSPDKNGEPGDNAAPPTSAPPATTTSDVKATGKVIVVEMFTDEKGNYFKPSDFEVHRGDMIRFTLGSGVHNVHFLPDSNPGAKNLPPMSEFLQLPGQTYEFVVAMAPGKYFFQCDPHALLGMVGRIEVEDEND